MSDQPRNWDKELADIDRVIGRQGGEAPASRAVTPGPSQPPSPRSPARAGSVALTWFWVLLAVGLAVALPLWPYQRTCGLKAIFFLGATGLTALVGVLAAASSWANRRGFAHLLSLVAIAWAGVMAASEVLPRVGYAREVRTWTCPAEPVPTPQPVPAPAPGAAAPERSPAPAQQSPAPAAPNAAPAAP